MGNFGDKCKDKRIKKKYMKPNNYVPDGSWLTFIRQTVFPKRGKTGNICGENKAMAIYRCKCGVEIETCMYNVKGGSKRSCGCLRKHVILPNTQNITHGLSKHPLYLVWKGIKNRCYYKDSNRYYCYGALGVTMCDEWVKNPEKFIKWALANGWKKGMNIDKDIIPKKLGIPAKIYSPEMCSVVTPKENSHAKGVKMYKFNDVVKPLADWSIELKISRKTLQTRLKTMEVDVAFGTLKTPVKKRNKYGLKY